MTNTLADGLPGKLACLQHRLQSDDNFHDEKMYCAGWNAALDAVAANAAAGAGGLVEFTEYVVKNYPPMTIISDPAWHAPKLYSAALHSMKGGLDAADRGLIARAAREVLDTELGQMACTGSDAPCEDALGRLRDALAVESTTPPPAPDVSEAEVETLESLRSLSNAATKGPWRTVWTGRSGSGFVKPENRHYSVVGINPAIPGFMGERPEEVASMSGEQNQTDLGNSDFIVACVNYVRQQLTAAALARAGG